MVAEGFQIQPFNPVAGPQSHVQVVAVYKDDGALFAVTHNEPIVTSSGEGFEQSLFFPGFMARDLLGAKAKMPKWAEKSLEENQPKGVYRSKRKRS